MNHLLPYIQNPRDALCNFQLGWEYESLGQTGAAISFYLRAAEHAQDVLLQYECLLRMSLCFEKQRTRDDTQRVLLQKAVALIMDRPEAYFLLSRSYERQEQWHEGWTWSNIALRVCRWDHPPLITPVEYPGEYGIHFERGVCAWWVGETEESRRVMFDLRYSWPLDDQHRAACERNLTTCGWPRFRQPYDAGRRSQFRAPFPGLERITENHSQSLQDLFVLAATQGHPSKWYLEVGSAEPFYHNNTALLETQFGWQGVSIEIDATKVAQFRSARRNPVIQQDATTINWRELLAGLGAPRDQGYLQIDCDPAENSYRILTAMPWDYYRWAVVTFEHDYYADTSVRDRSRVFLQQQGYELMAGDIAFTQSHSYEDWWVHPDLVPAEIRDQLRDTTPVVKPADQYLFARSA